MLVALYKNIFGLIKTFLTTFFKVDFFFKLRTFLVYFIKLPLRLYLPHALTFSLCATREVGGATLIGLNIYYPNCWKTIKGTLHN